MEAAAVAAAAATGAATTKAPARRDARWRLRCNIDELVGEVVSAGHQGSGSSLGTFQGNAGDEDGKGGVVVTHDLPLRSSYAQRVPELDGKVATTGEPAFTSYHRLFQGCVDYIWYTDAEERRGLWHEVRRQGDGGRSGSWSGSGSASASGSGSGGDDGTSSTSSSSSSSSSSPFATIACCGVDELPKKQILDVFENGLPTKTRSSDHLPLIARFRWKRR